MAIALIPARGGSKRIPNKNIKPFHGKPIIGYSIEAAQQSGCFERIIVSTDDSDIARVALSCGAEVPFIRPAEFADDHATTIDVILHTLDWLSERQQCPEYLCTIYATAPFIEAAALSDSLELLEKNKRYQYCFGVTEFPSPIQRAFRISPEGTLDMFYPEHFLSRSQDLEQAYYSAGQFCWGRAKAFLEGISMYSGTSIPFLLPGHKVQDIDTLEDWAKAEALYLVNMSENWE
jgi:pseudaminic acid cytidylyltransferase